GCHVILGRNKDVVDVMVVAQSDQAIHAKGDTIARMSVEYKWKPPRCSDCLVFGHMTEQCPKRVEVVPHTSVPHSNEKSTTINGDGFTTVVNRNKPKERRVLRADIDKHKLVARGILKKLDRIIGNLDFVNKFPGAYALFQPYRISNHSPAVLKMPSLSVAKPKPFKFYNFLAHKDKFSEVVASTWCNQISGHAMFQVTQKMKLLKKPLRKLLHDQGNLHERVDRLCVELDAVFWVKGNQYPDLDTMRLFGKRVSNTFNANMIRGVTNAEIRKAVFDIRDIKSPSPDGYTSTFFKKGWDVVGEDVCRAIQEIEAYLKDESISSEIDHANYDPKGDICLIEKLLNDDPFQLLPMDLKQGEVVKAKSSIEETPELELKDLPSHLEYAFLEGVYKLPKITDINGIDPRFCTHKILMEEDYKPAVQSQRRFNLKIHEVIKKEVIKLLDAGMIYPISDSLWVSPIHCVPKKGGIIVVENENNELIPTRKLNDATRKDHFPLPFMDQMLKRLAGNEFYCFLDGFSGYFQIPIDPQDQEKTTFICPYGTFVYRRMLFGLCNAPGHIILKSGIEVDRAKVDVITKLPHLTTVKGVMSFLGHAGFYRRFIQDFSKITRAMTHLLEKETPFVFSKECIDVINTLKKKLIEAPILIVPDWNLPFKLMCDASDYAIGAVLGQHKSKHFQSIHYASKTMIEAQTHYTTTEKEMLAVDSGSSMGVVRRGREGLKLGGLVVLVSAGRQERTKPATTATTSRRRRKTFPAGFFWRTQKDSRSSDLSDLIPHVPPPPLPTPPQPPPPIHHPHRHHQHHLAASITSQPHRHHLLLVTTATTTATANKPQRCVGLFMTTPVRARLDLLAKAWLAASRGALGLAPAEGAFGFAYSRQRVCLVVQLAPTGAFGWKVLP
nr:DNA-directed DNA polymerase [Tanacetum cinerariifolium]